MDKQAHLKQDISSLGRMGARSPMMAYESLEQALSGQPSKNRLSLNGSFEFSLYPCPQDVPEFYRTDFDSSAMGTITVPGNWETQGFGEPIYTNLVFPWNYEDDENCNIKPGKDHAPVPNPPYVPANNPTGCYRKRFTLPKAFSEGRELSLYFEGVETAFHLWVNGEYVGYSEDSKLPAEFNVTKYLKPGENLIALQVMRFATSTYLEDQDYWYLSGIHRDVWLISKPNISIEDYKLRAIPDLHHLSGFVTADVSVSRKEGFADYSVGLALYDGSRLLCQSSGGVMPIARYRTKEQPTANTARVELYPEKIELWSPESPKLYTLVCTLYSPQGEAVDIEACKLGFKKLETIDGVLYLNGQRLLIRGVNRHEHYPLGRTVPREHMVEEIKQMKRMNINSVRTCHYPDSSLWCSLCDEYGLLLICECNLETHGVEGQLSHNGDWAMAYLERASRMVRTHKNHVSIYSWSLGNESGTGANHAAMYGFIKEYDHDRICQYEAGMPGKNISDIRGNMYAPVHQIMSMLADVEDNRPIILVEYLYQIANSGGGACKFRQLLEDYPRFQGGYVWDWQDKCLMAKTADGKEFFGYGGDFDESYVEHDCPPFMTNNGLVLPDLRWKPVAHEMREVYAPVRVERPKVISPWQPRQADDCFILRNDTDTLPLSAFSCTAYLKENGRLIESAPVELPELAPRSTCSLQFSIPHTKKPGMEYYIDFVVSRKSPQWYQDDGDFVSATQHRLKGESFRPAAPCTAGEVKIAEDENTITLTAGEHSYTLCKNTAALLSAKKGSVYYLEESMKPCFTRPRSGVDCEPSWGSYKDHFAFEGTTQETKLSFTASGRGMASAAFNLSFKKEGAELAHGGLSYVLYGDGSLQIEYSPTIFPLLVPRCGLGLTVPEGFDKLSYYGYGENENYCDRMESARLGIYSGTVEQQHFPFIPPSENGGHEGTRWISLENSLGNSLNISGLIPFHFDAHHSTVEDYMSAAHDHQLVRRPQTFVHLDAAHSQIGSEMAWSTQLDENLHIGAKSHRLGFLLQLK